MKKVSRLKKSQRVGIILLSFGFSENLFARISGLKVDNDLFFPWIVVGGVALIVLVILEFFSRRAKKTTEENNS